MMCAEQLVRSGHALNSSSCLSMFPARSRADGLKPSRRRRRRRTRIAIAAAGLAAMGLLAAACGGTTASTSSASGSDGVSSGSSAQREAELLKFSECMRSHGITDFPDPTSSGLSVNATATGDLSLQSPQYQAAESACSKYMPGANLTVTQQSAAALKYSECMRSHGLLDFPGPNGQGEIITSGQGDLDPQSPQFQEAQSECASLAGPFKMQIGNGVLPNGGSSAGSADGG
jgi:hypothetical protein